MGLRSIPMKNESLNPKLSIIFGDVTFSFPDPRPSLTIDGKFIGKVDRMDFSRNGKGLVDLGLRRLEVTPGHRMPGVPSVEDDIPRHLEDFVILKERGHFAVLHTKKDEDEDKKKPDEVEVGNGLPGVRGQSSAAGRY